MSRNFLKKEFVDFVFAGNIMPEHLSALKNAGKSKQMFLNLLDKREAFKKFIGYFDDAESNILFIEGENGTGKTAFLKTFNDFLEDGIFSFYYDCSVISNLDDIILAIFNFLKIIAAKDSDYRRNFKVSSYLSIDEKIINSLKKLKRPLVINIDGFDNYIKNDNNNLKDFEILLSYLATINNLKVIVSTSESIKFEKIRKAKNLYLERLSIKQTYLIIKKHGISISEDYFKELFFASQGKPENILYFVKLLDVSQMPAGQIIDNYLNTNKSFEEFIEEKLYDSIPSDIKSLAHYFCCIRHGVSLKTLETLNFDNTVNEKLNLLKSRMILIKNAGIYYMKNSVKQVIYSKISVKEKKQLHRFFYELYMQENSKKLEDRIFSISRNILHQEQAYHAEICSELDVVAEEKTSETAGCFIKKQENVKFDNKNEELREEPTASFVNSDFDIKLSEEEYKLIESGNREVENDPYQQTPKLISSSIDELANIKLDKINNNLSNSNSLADKARVNDFLYYLAELYNKNFNHNNALNYYNQILKSDPKSISEEIKSKIYISIGDIYSYRENFEQSLYYYNNALDQAEKNRDEKLKAEINFKIALVYDDIGDISNAINYYKENIQVSSDFKINSFVAASYANIASIFEESGDMKKAEEFYIKSIQCDESADNLEGMYETLSKLGNIYFETGELDKAYQNFKKELDISKKMKDPYKIAMSYIDLGDIYFLKKDYEKAIKSFIIAKKSIANNVSTDSKEKINSRIKKVQSALGDAEYLKVLEKIKTAPYDKRN